MTIEEILRGGFPQQPLNQSSVLESLKMDDQSTGGMFGDFNTGDMSSLLKGFGQLYTAYTGRQQVKEGERQNKYIRGITDVNLSNSAGLAIGSATDLQDRRNADKLLNISLGGRDSGVMSTADKLSQLNIQGAV